MKNVSLTNKTQIKVRFSEVDSMKVAWHGHYVKYIEDGREAFGTQYGVSYLDFFSNGILVPIVNIEIDYKRFLLIGEEAVIETKYVDSKAAKIHFEFTITGKQTNQIIATAKSVQVFLDTNHELLLNTPEFFMQWKRKWGITE